MFNSAVISYELDRGINYGLLIKDLKNKIKKQAYSEIERETTAALTVTSIPNSRIQFCYSYDGN